MVVNSLADNSDTALHELGHALSLGRSMYPGERESIVHVPYTFASNEIAGNDIDTAFDNSISTKLQCRGGTDPNGCKSYQYSTNRLPNMNIDQAATDWMVRPNFRNGLEMDRSNTETDEVRYQHRGHAKYADMARIMGDWQWMSEAYLMESLDIEAGSSSLPACANNLEDSDKRTFRFSLKACVDFTPIVHFWGVQPVDEVALAACMAQNTIPSSPAIKAQLEHYLTIVPPNQTAFIAQYDAIWTGKIGMSCGNPTYSWCWYENNYASWDETVAAQTVAAVEEIILKYFPETPTTTTSKFDHKL